MSNELLPIGSVIKTRHDDQLFMIIGYYPEYDEISYDYSSVMYPEGILELPNMFFFNEDEIDDCLYEGYQDEDGIEALHAARRIVELRAQMNAELVQVAADYISSHAEEFNLNELLAVEEPNV